VLLAEHPSGLAADRAWTRLLAFDSSFTEWWTRAGRPEGLHLHYVQSRTPTIESKAERVAANGAPRRARRRQP